jgi:hypothetical protein
MTVLWNAGTLARGIAVIASPVLSREAGQDGPWRSHGRRMDLGIASSRLQRDSQ